MQNDIAKQYRLTSFNKMWQNTDTIKCYNTKKIENSRAVLLWLLGFLLKLAAPQYWRLAMLQQLRC